METCQFLFKIEKEPGSPTVSRHSCFTKQKCKQRHQIYSEFSSRFVSEIPIAFSCGTQSLAFQKYLWSAWKNKIFKKPVSNCPPFRGSLLTLGMYSVALLTVFFWTLLMRFFFLFTLEFSWLIWIHHHHHHHTIYNIIWSRSIPITPSQKTRPKIKLAKCENG